MQDISDFKEYIINTSSLIYPKMVIGTLQYWGDEMFIEWVATLVNLALHSSILFHSYSNATKFFNTLILHKLRILLVLKTQKSLF